ncbi:hypothetical protein [Ralstonia solanacearum]|uniref:hypothetical protein n=1 Tax=Ralstonia solanacearum TaxID=305 RepID=UPI0013015A5D|nr:hypothetical protein [Ralstonia solanacearum]
MKTIFRNSYLAASLAFLFTGCAGAASHGPIELTIKQVDDSPAACIPMSDARGDQPVQIVSAGVWRATGPVSTEDYWSITIPPTSTPFFVKRGACIVYGQKIEGAEIETAPRTLEPGKSYAFSIIPNGNGTGQVYGASFCVKKTTNGKRIILQETGASNPCVR